MQIHTGYKTIIPIQLANAIWALNQRLIDHQGLRVYLATFAMVAVRETAQRYRRKRHERPREYSRYGVDELERLTRLNSTKVRRALRQLKRAGLMTFAERKVDFSQETLFGSEELQSVLSCGRSPIRPIPFPRSILLFLALNRSEALTKVAIAYVVRGLALARTTGIISGKGTVKASWISQTFGLSQRAVRYAQAELRESGWITKDTQSFQRKLNRDGAYFVINLAWKSGTLAIASQGTGGSVGVEEGRPFVNRDKAGGSFAPPGSEYRPVFAPPIENKKTSIERDQYQESRSAGSKVSGVCSEGKRKPPTPEPTLANIRREDLHHFGRLEALYFQGVQRGWIGATEAAALNFLGAAVRAREVGFDPPRLFVSLVRRALWQNINQSQEDQGRKALVSHREEDPERFRFSGSQSKSCGPGSKAEIVSPKAIPVPGLRNAAFQRRRNARQEEPVTPCFGQRLHFIRVDSAKI